MANLNCVFFKFCVCILFFVKFSVSNHMNNDLYYKYIAEDSDRLQLFKFGVHRLKRDTSATVPVTTTAETKKDSEIKSTKDATIDTAHLLGVNGTGQRKEYSTNITATKSTELTAETTSKSTSVASTQPSPIDTRNPVESSLSDDFEKIVDAIDDSDDAINKTISKHTTNSKQKVDFFQYYNSIVVADKNKSNEYWSDTKNYTVSNILSKSHRRAITVQLKFEFPFYGHPVRNVTVATGGFLYTGEYVHSWLAATQYIAPLMANFDTSISNVSIVKYADNGTAFTVIWENVPLQDNNMKTMPLFTFSVTLYNTGDITFAYKNIPMAIDAIKDEKHPVKIGLSDAYIIDKTIYFARRKTIYEYHRVNFNGQDIQNDTIITLTALSTCLEHTDCESCLKAKIDTFNCTWCPSLNRCSTGTDRKRQEWIQSGCERTTIKEVDICPALGAKGNNYSSQQQVATPVNNSDRWISTNADSSKTNNQPSLDVKKAAFSHDEQQPKQTTTSFAIGILLPIIVIITLLMWVFYAYRNPHTKSGQLLIQYRPSQWSWRRGEARYTAATIHM